MRLSSEPKSEKAVECAVWSVGALLICGLFAKAGDARTATARTMVERRIMGVFLCGFIGINPFFPMAPTVGYRFFLAGVQVCLLIVEGSVIYYTILELFKKDLGLPIKLWGAAALYLMIGFTFGSFYEILCTMEVDCLGVDVPLRTVALIRRIGYSLMVLSGMDTPYPNVSDLLHAAATVEALFGQLFIVLIVGRLLTK